MNYGEEIQFKVFLKAKSAVIEQLSESVFGSARLWLYKVLLPPVHNHPNKFFNKLYF